MYLFKYIYSKKIWLPIGLLLTLTACGSVIDSDGGTTNAAVTPSCTIGETTLGSCKL